MIDNLDFAFIEHSLFLESDFKVAKLCLEIHDIFEQQHAAFVQLLIYHGILQVCSAIFKSFGLP